MSKPWLLDLFCGGGGCSYGYHLAGFEVVGVDNVVQPNYPFEFHLADALTFPLDGFDCYHASPPCPRYTMMLNHGMADRSKHPDYVDIIRKRLQGTGKPYIIENVMGAPVHGIMLCGNMFGLRVYRHRLFESNTMLFQPAHVKHTARIAHAGNIPTPEQFYCPVGHLGDKHGAQRAMGINWMHTQKEIANAIPPEYTRYLGEQLMYVIMQEKEAIA